MATQTLRPNSDGNYSNWNIPIMGSHYTEVDEASQDGDTTYIGCSGTTNNVRDSFGLESWSPGSVTISSVRMHFWAKTTGGDPRITPFLRLSSTDNDGTAIDPAASYTEYSEEISRPGGGSWQLSDFSSLEAGAYYTGGGGKLDGARVTQAYIVVTYSVGTFGPPSALLCERLSYPTDVSEAPIYSAIFNGDAGGGADRLKVQASEKSDFSTTEWDSGWLTITTVTNGNRCEEVTYGDGVAGDSLSSDPPDSKYYWRCWFKRNSDGKESGVSAIGYFEGINRSWADPNYAYRRKLMFDRNHPQIDANYVAEFNFQTGHRKQIASNSSFNEGIQASGGRHIEYFNGKTHIAWLSKYDNNQRLGIYIATLDHYTGEWSDPIYIDDAHTTYDTHHFPSIVIDNSGYIHIFYGCHYNVLYYTRSQNPNDSSSWTTPKTLGSGQHTYPIGFCVPSTGRIYVFYRGQGSEKKHSFKYSDNNGTTWYGSYVYLDNTSGSGYRVYQYGFRFDKSTERLHIAWSYIDTPGGNMTQGAWYAYSDYEDSGCGFISWYDIGGVKRGDTSTDPVDRASGISAIIETDASNQYFVNELSLTKDGKPIVFITHHHFDDTPQDEQSIVVARYSAGWQLSYVTADHDYQMINGRSGIPCMTDRDGVLHAITAINGMRHLHGVPTSNGNHTNYTVYPSGNGYAAIDDGVDKCDGDTSYIYKAGAFEASFNDSKTLPAKAKLLAVTVEVLARCVPSTSGSIKPFLRIGTTDYEGGAQTVTQSSNLKYPKYTYTWHEDPSTSSAWTKTAAQNAEFGVKQFTAGATVRISRILKRYKVCTATDDELYAGEMIELTSSDGGANWLVKELTENSGIGTPIISCKHHTTNDTMEFCWVSGNDIFYYREEPFGKVLRSGRDLKLYYQSSTNTEIDRYLDYPNHETTLIRFAVQDVVLSKRKAAGGDYLLYYGKPNGGDDSPKSDPNIVASRGYDNFEELFSDSNLNGQAGWTVNSGSATIFEMYVSSTFHTNKIYSGIKSVKISSAGEIEKTIDTGTGLENVLILFGIWLESSSSVTIKLQAVDNSSNVFSAGVNNSTKYAGYEDGSGWHDHATIRARAQNYYRMAIQITPEGGSAWIDGVQICEQISSITSVKKFKIITGAYSFVDYTVVLTKLFKKTLGTISSGFTYNDMVFNPAHSSVWQTGADGKHNITEDDGYENIYKLEVKVRARQTQMELDPWVTFQVWVSNKEAYDSTDIDDEDSATIHMASGQGGGVPGAWVSETITFNNLTTGDKSIKVDAYDSNLIHPLETVNIEIEIEEIKVYYEVRDPLIVTGDEDVRGWFSDAAIQGSGADSWISDSYVGDYKLLSAASVPIGSRLVRSAIINTQIESSSGFSVLGNMPIENRSRVSGAGHVPIENRIEQSAVSQIPFDSQRFAEMLGCFPISNRSGLSAVGHINIENSGNMGAATTLPIENKAGRSSTVSIPVDSMVGVSSLGHFPIESLQTISAISHIPIDNGSLFVAIAATPFDSRLIRSAIAQAAVESLLAVSQSTNLPVESLLKVISFSHIPFDFRGILSAIVGIPIESSLKLSSQSNLPSEFKKLFSATIGLPIENLSVISGAGHVPIDYRGRLGGVYGIPLENLVGMSSISQSPCECLVGVTSAVTIPYDSRMVLTATTHINAESRRVVTVSASMPSESLLGLSSPRLISIENLVALSSISVIPLEYQGLVAFTSLSSIPIESGLAVSATGMMPVDSRAVTSSVTALSIESLLTRSSLTSIPIDWKALLSTRSNIPVESLKVIMCSSHLNFDHLLGVHMASQIPIESKVIVSHVTNIPIENLGLASFTVSANIPIEFRTAVNARANAPVESRTGLSQSASLPLSNLRALSVTANTPVDVRGVVTANTHIVLESSTRISSLSEMPVEFLRIVESISNIVYDTAAILGVQARVNFDCRSEISAIGTINIEFGRSFGSVTAQFSLESLLQVAAAANIPIENLGYLCLGLVLCPGEISTYGVSLNTMDGYDIKNIEAATYRVTLVELLPDEGRCG